MRKLVWLLCLVLLFTGLAYAQESDAAEEEMDWVTWSLDEGETMLTVRLAGNATTGFQWMVEIEPDGLVEVVEEEYIQDEVPEDAGFMAGVGGTSVFVISPALTEEGSGGAVVLVFSYAQPWDEETEPAIQLVIEVWVVEDGTMQMEDVYQMLPEGE